MTETRNRIERRVAAFDVVRILLAAILLVAAALKGHQLATEPVAGKDIFSYRWSLMLQVQFEIVFGLWLLSGAFKRLTWALALGCFAFFCLVTLYKALSGEASCGCFGKVDVNPWYTLILDVSAVAALLVFRPQPVTSQPVAGERQRERRRFVVAAVLAAILGIPAGIAMGTYTPARISSDGTFFGSGSIVLLEPEEWVGQRLPIRDYISGVDLDQGNWIVLLADHSCPNCRRTIAEYRRTVASTADAAQGLRFALVEVPPYGLSAEQPGSKIVRAKLRDEKDWFVTTPVVLLMHDGEISRVWQDKDIPELETIIQTCHEHAWRAAVTPSSFPYQFL